MQRKTGINPTQLLTPGINGFPQIERLLQTVDESLEDDPEFFEAADRLRKGLGVSADPAALVMLLKSLSKVTSDKP